MNAEKYILWFDEIGKGDIALVGGKNANLGELTRHLAASGIAVPPGFAVSAEVYRDFIDTNQLAAPIAAQLSALSCGKQRLAETGRAIRENILAADFSDDQRDAIEAAYEQLCARVDGPELDVAVRSSATAEDLPEASFAGQQESYLNVRGAEALLQACRACFASLYTDRAIAYREERGFAHQQVALSVAVQQMVRSDKGSAGVMFTLDPESGFPDMVVISGAWGLGEAVVKGSVNPDRYKVYKPLLDNTELAPIVELSRGGKLTKFIYSEPDAENGPVKAVVTSKEEQRSQVLDREDILQLARWGAIIEKHYGRPMDIEWAKDGITGELFVVQARPETIESQKDPGEMLRYQLQAGSRVLVEGASVGSAIAAGQVQVMRSAKRIGHFPEGSILVAERTDPDWVPVLRKAAGIVTDTGGPTSHAAIVSRELNVPAIVGTGNASKLLKSGSLVTLNCAEGAVGKVHEGILPYQTEKLRLDECPETRTDVMINVAMPDSVFNWWKLPIAGIGLARIEFIISSLIQIHPMALLYPEQVSDKSCLAEINRLTADYPQRRDYFTEKLALGIGKIASVCYPKPVIVRFSDFKSNEFHGLLGGEFFEITEANPMLGLRGASRYYHPRYREAFTLECRAIKKVREEMGFDNVIVMIPFCRTTDEADRVLAIMADAGLEQGANGLEIYIMCEIPANVVLAEEFAERFDGFSIGSNDLTQLVLGVDRDSAELRELFDPRDKAVKRMISQVISVAHDHRCKVGICGQAPSDYPEFAEFLVSCGIDSISLNPDSLIKTLPAIAAAERRA